MALRALDTVKYHTKYYRNLPTLDRHSLGTKVQNPLASGKPNTRAGARAPRPARPQPVAGGRDRRAFRRRGAHARAGATADSHSEQRVSFMKRHGTHARGWGVGPGAWGRLYMYAFLAGTTEDLYTARGSPSQCFSFRCACPCYYAAGIINHS